MPFSQILATSVANFKRPTTNASINHSLHNSCKKACMIKSIHTKTTNRTGCSNTNCHVQRAYIQCLVMDLPLENRLVVMTPCIVWCMSIAKAASSDFQIQQGLPLCFKKMFSGKQQRAYTLSTLKWGNPQKFLCCHQQHYSLRYKAN